MLHARYEEGGRLRVVSDRRAVAAALSPTSQWGWPVVNDHAALRGTVFVLHTEIPGARQGSCRLSHAADRCISI
jgi:hypothetical protein